MDRISWFQFVISIHVSAFTGTQHTVRSVLSNRSDAARNSQFAVTRLALSADSCQTAWLFGSQYLFSNSNTHNTHQAHTNIIVSVPRCG